MRVCVCGWYFNDGFLDALDASGFPAFVVKHREHPVPFASETIPNRGLEWGAYSWYLQNKWPGDGAVLFTHDDVEVRTPSAFNEISRIPHDCAYIFCDPDQVQDNGGRGRFQMGLHGRAVYMSKKLLQVIRHEGFWFDAANEGYVLGKAQPDGVQDYNLGVIKFHEKMTSLQNEGYDSLNNVLVPGYRTMRRGEKIR